jgi:hypothetical protein
MAWSEINFTLSLADDNPGAARLSDLTARIEREAAAAVRQVCYEHEFDADGAVLLSEFNVTTSRRIG